ncbi:MAG: 4Fe-4S binding protein [Clostridiales Family XIII bacterium]|jgi:adenylylsulfate reductase subunit B|nr:4Fe-4S binding protein [Clostridiales Family XIII bacterium]
MAITIDAKKCTACGKCAEICPEDVLLIEDGKAFAKYPKECWHCGSCVYDCRFGAIEVDLELDTSVRFIEF